tara:strand:+ start:324 stop:1889 length:1566 start_codon:yes stop_codon:yes gene_type:complete
LLNNIKTAGKRYSNLAMSRQCFLNRAWDGAEVTIPFLLPRDGVQNQELPTPFQAIGARGLNNLAAKLLLTLFPPSSPFIKFQIDDFTLAELEAERAPVEEGLNSMERAVNDEVEAKAMRVPIHELLRHLILSGNAVLFVNPDNKLRVFHLDQYCVRRDPQGEVLEIIIKEEISRELFEDIFDRPPPQEAQTANSDTSDKPLELYTVVRRKKDRVLIHQEVQGIKIPGTDSDVPHEKSPYLALRFIRIDGEDYGRGFVEEYLGDLRALEGLSKAILEGSAAAARAIFLVRPNGTTKPKTISQAPNLAVRQGNADDVSVLQLDKFNDFRVARETIDTTERRLAAAFLLNQSVQRDAERVTAEEIRFLANELETTLGGIYSLLSHELQLPLAKRIIASLEKQKKLPALPKGTVEPVIVTGFEALGRGSDAQKLLSAFQAVSSIFGPEAVIASTNIPDAIKRVFTGFGIDQKGLIKTPEQLQQEQEQQQQAQQQQQQAEMVKAAIPNAVTQGGDMIKQGAQQQNG